MKIHSMDNEPEADALPMQRYKHWYDAITRDDVTKVTTILSDALKGEKHRLLNGRFIYDNISDVPLNKIVNAIHRPLILALTCRSIKVLKVIHEEGADPEVRDIHNFNIFHVMAVQPSFVASSTEAVLEIYRYFLSALKPEVTRRLLHAEAGRGHLRPAELAAQQNNFGVMMAFLDTDGVYVTRRERAGMTEYIWCDVTDYESEAPDGRRLLSPLTFVENMDRATLGCAYTNTMMLGGLINTWQGIKTKTFLPFYFIWAIYRVITTLCFFALDMDTGLLESVGGVAMNQSGIVVQDAFMVFCQGYSFVHLRPGARKAIEIFVCITSGISLIITAILVVTRMRKTRGRDLDFMLTRKRATVKQSVIFDVSHPLFCAMLFIYASLLLSEGRMGYFLYDAIRIILINTAIISMFYFIQLLPGIGHYIITLNRMLSDLLRFIVVFIIIQIPFIVIIANVMNTHGKQCYGDFSSMVETSFTIFRMMLNLVDVTQYDITYKYTLYFVHIIYVFIISILLINFLIAVMASSVDMVNTNKPIIMNVQTLWVCSQVQEILSLFAPCLHRKLAEKKFERVGDRICIAYSKPLQDDFVT